MQNDKKKLETFPFNLYCIDSNLPMSLDGSKTNGPHLQKQALKSRILLLSAKGFLFGCFFFKSFSLKKI